MLGAENGEDALRVSEEHEGPIQLMITDVVMPKMSGKETVERLQPLHPQMKVIYVGVHGQRHCSSRCFGTGTEFYRKAFHTGRFGAQGTGGAGQKIRSNSR